MRLRKNNPILKLINSGVIDLPSSPSLNYLWNFGSLLGLSLIIQILTGIFLAMHFCPEVELAFQSISHISRDVNYGFLLKFSHANGASIFFICVYVHIARSLYYGGYLRTHLWFSGVTIFLIMMLTAFIGYVLPWGQMSFWGATVITNFLSAVPYIGQTIVEWAWGGFSINNATLNRFFSLHYLFPFVLLGLIIIHLVLLHEKGSNNPLGLSNKLDLIPFHHYYIVKDLLGFILLFILLLILVCFFPNYLGDPENFIKANSLVTPIHIMPEWYFLFAYAILRAIPNKLGGVIGLVLSILILFTLPFTHTSKIGPISLRPLGKIIFWWLVFDFFILTWIGAKPVEDPYIFIGQCASIYYFFHFLVVIPLLGLIENWFFFRFTS